ncbi:MAG: Xaa-Pro peptidase family protein [Ignavibacteriaceae bacterium]
MDNKIFLEKVEQAIGILKEKDIDMWITFARESSIMPDPVMEIIIGRNSTWESAFIICEDGDTTAIVGEMEKENFAGKSGFRNVTGYVKSFSPSLLDYLKKKNPKNIAINYSQNSVLADGLTHGFYLKILDYLKGSGFENKLISAEEIISALKGRKSATEISIMTEAVNKTLDIFDQITGFIKPGKSEKEIASFVKSIMQEKGFEPAWEEETCPAVFTGPDTQSAHSGPTDRKVERGHLINMDFGILYKGYCSDLQRTWYVLKDGEDKAPAEVQKGFEVIRDAIQKVVRSLKPGVAGCDMDDIARNYIVEQGYEEFPHGLGHQVGRRVHDGGCGLFPRWEKYGNAPFMKVEENQIFTIEPRLTVKGYGTSTLEEEVIVKKEGAEFISKPQKELILIK